MHVSGIKFDVFLCKCTKFSKFCFNPLGAVGLPFKYVNFMIGVYNAYVKGEYEVIVEGNQKEVMVTEGGSIVALHIKFYMFYNCQDNFCF